MKFASVRIITHDLDRIVAFYENVTGLTASRPTPFFAELVTPGGAVAFGSVETVAMLGPDVSTPENNTSVLLEFEVDDVDAEYARLKDDLDDVVLEPSTMPWGNRSTVFRDPDGNLVNLYFRPAR